VTRSKVGRLVLALLFALAARTVPGLPPDPDSGVVVEKTTPGFEAAKAGFQAGDVLLGWERAPNPPANPTSESGVFRSPFDVQEAYVDQAPRARTLTFRLTRDGQKVSVPILQYPWGLETRPRFSEERLLRYELGKQSIAQGEREKGLDVWRTLAGDLSGAKRHVEAAWLWARISKAQSEAKENDAAIASLDRALAAARPAGRRDIDAQLWGSKVEVLRGANRQEDARSAARQAMSMPPAIRTSKPIRAISSPPPSRLPIASPSSTAPTPRTTRSATAISRSAGPRPDFGARRPHAVLRKSVSATAARPDQCAGGETAERSAMRSAGVHELPGRILTIRPSASTTAVLRL